MASFQHDPDLILRYRKVYTIERVKTVKIINNGCILLCEIVLHISSFEHRYTCRLWDGFTDIVP